MTVLYFIRHGESEANREKRFAGNYDVDLTELGYSQAAHIPSAFADVHVDAIFASDLKRAYQTAVPLAASRGLEIIKAPDFREIFAGAWEGALFDEIMKKHSAAYAVWKTDIGRAVCTDGESVAHLAERVLAAAERIAREYDGKTVVIATHATPIRALATLWSAGDLAAMKDTAWVPNASVTRVSFENGIFTLEEIGCTEHLDGLLTRLPANV
ncbi:MAG: histidine phosphatase family protein [Clostridia bacterium]|nr:histidine phosphatase family protein [Clostridia bacterium]